MREPYDPVILASDATRFTRTRFGKHYLARLEAMRDDYTRKATDGQLSTQERGELGLRASWVASELTYFATAQTVTSNPKLMERMAANFKKRMKGGKTEG